MGSGVSVRALILCAPSLFPLKPVDRCAFGNSGFGLSRNRQTVLGAHLLTIWIDVLGYFYRALAHFGRGNILERVLQHIARQKHVSVTFWKEVFVTRSASKSTC